MLRRLSLFVIFLAACGTPAQTTKPTATMSEPASPPVAGRDTISADDLRAHVEALASDAFGGRETLQPGAVKAAAYVAARFAEYGLAPLPGQSEFLVSYEMYALGFDEARTSVEIAVGEKKHTLKAGEDFVPFAFSDEGEAEAEVVFVGYGITAPEAGWDDYEGLDVKGKVVLVLRYQPIDKDKEKPRFKDNTHSLFLTKAQNAVKHGAVGMLLVTGPLHREEADDLRMRGRLSITKPKRKKPEQRGPQFLAVHVSRPIAGEMIAPLGLDLPALQEKVDGGAKPRALALSGVRAKLVVEAKEEPKQVRSHNVVGFLEGSDPTRKDQWVVIGAHYDHLGTYAGEGDTTYNGADDNASGTAGLLELAQAFSTLPARPGRSMVFIAFSGEEEGLLGSRAMFEQEQLSPEKIVFMLNLDMIGRNDDKPVQIVGDAYGTGLKEAVTASNADIDLEIELGGTRYSGNSDHHPFYTNDIPFMFFFTGFHEDYHQLTDQADKIAYPKTASVVHVAYGVLDTIAKGGLTPAFIHHISWLGVALEGATIMEVEESSRAAEAGLKKGDVIEAFGEAAVEEADGVGKLLREVEPGLTVVLGVRRGASAHKIQVERAKQGYLGIFPGALEEDERKKLGLGAEEGVKVGDLVGDGPAGKAGIQAGDILIRIGGLPVGLRTLSRRLARIGAGEKVSVEVIRAGERITLTLRLGERPKRP